MFWSDDEKQKKVLDGLQFFWEILLDGEKPFKIIQKLPYKNSLGNPNLDIFIKLIIFLTK